MKSMILMLPLLWLSSVYAQPDTLKYQWPVAPLNSSHSITGNFCEFRNTLSSDHFHNAVDIAKDDGEPCYSVFDGEVYSIYSSGSNAYVRVASKINGKWKHLTYLHIAPNPSLSVGDPVVKGVTVLGTIASGMGHVHLIERELVSGKSDYAAEINNTRPNGGLTPYIDTEPPVIDRNSLKFFIDGTDIEMVPYGLSGRVDIQVRIEEWNGPWSSHRNNGTYLAGYRIWNQDTSQIVYEPADAGVKYCFDRKPFNSYVHQVFVKDVATLSNPVYWLTNGSGANSINQTQTVTNSYFQASLLDTGKYVLEIFSEDTRGNQDIEYFPIAITDQDLTPPAVPEIYSIINTDKNEALEISWMKNKEEDLLGYRLYYSTDNQLSNWAVAADEFQLTRDSVSFYLVSPDSFIVPPAQDVYFFRLTAVDSSGNESDPSDVYARSVHMDGSAYNTALIVNGFTRIESSGSYHNPTHSFVKSYFDPLTEYDSLVVSSCSNGAVAKNKISLNDYHIVIWFVGDESTNDNTFTPTEQGKIKSYLENGGKLFVSGSEIGWDLEHKGSATDIDFYHNYFKAAYVYDGNKNMSPAKGKSGSAFSGIQLNYGQVYEEDYPDDIDPVNGSEVILEYKEIRSGSTYRRAGVAFTGNFGQSSKQGQMVYIAFPFETVSSASQRGDFMNALLGYFGVITGIDEPLIKFPGKFTLSQNYPNPFNPATQFIFSVPVREKVQIKIFDVLGREVQTLVNDTYLPGEYKVTWNAGGFASGCYFLKMQAGKFMQTKKMLFLR